jgi:hypothetical protein
MTTITTTPGEVYGGTTYVVEIVHGSFEVFTSYAAAVERATGVAFAAGAADLI